MQIEFLGAAQTVTGSKHLIRTARANVLLDCGLFQGRRSESMDKNRQLPLSVDELDAVVLSHAHLDHSGALPLLTKRGYRKLVYATPATRSLSAAMLEDSARIQLSDARHHEKIRLREGRGGEPIRALYDEEDVVQTLAHMVSVPYRQPQSIAPGVTLTFFDAGHVLGSAIVVLDIEEERGVSRLAFSGDLGRSGTPLMHDPEIPARVEYLICESTYGDRLHASIETRDAELEQVLWRTYSRGGKVVIPAFALERAQEILYALHVLRDAGRLPPMPVFVDSPLTVKLTDVFRLHPECLNPETRRRFLDGRSPFDFPELTYVTEREDSKALDSRSGPAVILSASGMCEGGRVVHHLRALLGDPRNTVLMVGFQAQHTLGRRLLEGQHRVRMFGLEYERRAEVAQLEGFSAHADQGELVRWVTAVGEAGDLRRVFLVHGELPAQRALCEKLSGVGAEVQVPTLEQRVEIC